MRFEVGSSAPGRLRVRGPAAWVNANGRRLEARLTRYPGVRSVTTSARTGSVLIGYDPGDVSESELLDALADAKRQASTPPPAASPSRHLPVPAGREKAPETIDAGATASWLWLTGATSTLIATLLPLPRMALTLLVLSAAAPAFVRAGRAILLGRRLSVDVLDGLSVSLLLLRGNLGAASLLTWLDAVGRFTLGRTVTRTRRSLRDLVVPPEETVWLAGGKRRRRVPVRALRPGDLIGVGARQRLFVDGTVQSGELLVDQQAVTGESLPVERRAGDRVHGFTVVEDGEATVRVEGVGRETTVGRIVEVVEASAQEKPELQVFAERLADRQVAHTLIMAAVGAATSRSLEAGVGILSADYGLAARVGVPTAVLGAILVASRAGILIKGPRVLEQLARVDTVVFDKTGTLTLGVPRVSRIVAYSPVEQPEDVLRLAAAAARGFPHPVSRAIARAAAASGVVPPRRAGGEARVGLGVQVTVDGARVLVGSRRFMESQGIDLEAAASHEAAAHERGGSVSFVACAGRLAGLIVLEDELRPDAQSAVQALRARRMRNVIMVSGDHRQPTQTIAASLGIRHYHAEILPEEKARLVRELRAENRVVAMVGDGVNDALALRAADVGIAIQGGVEVVAEAAGVVLLRGGLEKVVEALEIAQGGIVAVERAVDTAVQGHVAAMGLASFGLGGPFTCILVSHGAAVLGALSAVPGLAMPASPARVP